MWKNKHFLLEEMTEGGEASGGSQSPEGGSSNWVDSISDEYRDNISKFTDVDSLAKSYVELEKSMGSRIRIPSEDASTEQRQEFLDKLTKVDGVVKVPGIDDTEGWDQFYNSLGRPESQDLYEIPELKDAPPNVQRDENMENWIKELSYDIGLSQSQFNKLVSGYNEIIADVARSQLDEKGQVMDSLKNEWGADYDRRLGVIATVIKQFGNEELIQEFVDSGAGNNPELAKMLYTIGTKTLEDSVLSGGGIPEPTLVDLEDSANELRNHPAYLDSMHAQHSSVVAKVFELEKKIALQHEKNRNGDNAWNNDGGITL